jgi:23S rRNA-/tRNA-specific pseudouridylate synthase
MPSKRWVVGAEDDGAPLGAIVARLRAAREQPADGEDEIAEGRVFVGGRRATADARVRAGDLVEVWDRRRPPRGGPHRADREAAPRAQGAGGAPPGAVPTIEPLILARAGEVVLVAKPAGLPTEPERRGGDSLVSRLAARARVRAAHASSRLDVEVSGVVACALGPRGAERLARARERGALRRVYLAIAGGRLEGSGGWESPVGGKPAVTRWSACARARDATWLELELVTGRTHQIREHAAAASAALLGDGAHGGTRRFAALDGAMVEVRRPMLHAAAALLDDGAGPPLEATWPAPDELRATWLALDGAAAAWEGWLPPWRRA